MANDGAVRFSPVILAGGSGTRFWPRSRRARAKQVLALDGTDTMIQQTLERLLPVAKAEDVWVVTNSWLDKTISSQMPTVKAEHILSEPAARNTAPACALTAFLLAKTDPKIVLGVFPSDHVVGNIKRFAQVIEAGIKVAAAGENIVVLGVPVHRVKRFREKPDKHTAEKFLAAGNFAWNGGIFLWSAGTFVNAIREHAPDMAPILDRIAAAYGTPEFDEAFAREYPECENISVDYAVLERRSAKGEAKSGIYCLPADFEWNDLGSWASLHEHLGENEDSNVLDGATTGLVTIESKGNYVYAPGKMVALLGVEGLVVVETEDALLITTRERSQDVSKIVRMLHAGMGQEGLI